MDIPNLFEILQEVFSNNQSPEQICPEPLDVNRHTILDTPIPLPFQHLDVVCRTLYGQLKSMESRLSTLPKNEDYDKTNQNIRRLEVLLDSLMSIRDCLGQHAVPESIQEQYDEIVVVGNWRFAGIKKSLPSDDKSTETCCLLKSNPTVQ